VTGVQTCALPISPKPPHPIILVEEILNKKMQAAQEIDFNPDRVWKKKLPFNDGSGEGLLQIGYGCYQVTSEDPIYDAIKYGYRNLDTA